MIRIITATFAKAGKLTEENKMKISKEENPVSLMAIEKSPKATPSLILTRMAKPAISQVQAKPKTNFGQAVQRYLRVLTIQGVIILIKRIFQF